MTTTWNASDKTSGVALSGGNLVCTYSLTGSQGCRSVDKLITGKYYWEVTFTTVSGASCAGIANAAVNLAAIAGTPAGSVNTSCIWATSGQVYTNGVSNATLGTISNGTIICIAMDLVAELIWFRIGAAGNWNGSASNNPATGVGGYSISGVCSAGIPTFAVDGGNNDATTVHTANFGGSAFSGVVPSGFTSGFTSGTVIPTNVVVTQAAVEEWGLPVAPSLQVTQAAIEEWASVTTGVVSLAVTQVALEEWASVATRSPYVFTIHPFV